MMGFNASVQTSCDALLKQLQHIWTDIGESDAEKGRILSEIEQECLQVYERKLEEACTTKARFNQSVAAKEAELAAIVASIGELALHSKTDKQPASLREQLASVTPLVEVFRVKKQERVKQFADIRAQIQKLTSEINGYIGQEDVVACPANNEEHDLSIRKLNEYQYQLKTLQKQKSDRLHKVLMYANEVHSLCSVLGLDFQKTVDEVHPSLHGSSNSGQSTNISNHTLEGLAQIILKLKSEKKVRIQKLRETVESLTELWKLMDTPEEEKRTFGRLKYILGSTEEEINYKGILSEEIIEQIEAEFERLIKLKASRMKELVVKKRFELEEACEKAHMGPDTITVHENTNALIDSGLVDPSEILSTIESQIEKAKEESMSRKDIMDRISKWLAACEEEKWLQQYNQEKNRYSAGRGAHLNLKRAEKARVTITKIAGIVDNLISKIFVWEDERNMPFLYDGVRLVSILEEYKLTRLQKEEEQKLYRDHKKLQGLLLREKEAICGSNPSHIQTNSFNRKVNGYRGNGNRNGFMIPSPGRVSVGSATPELLTPRSYSGHQNGYFNKMRRLSAAPLNFVNLSREDTSSSFTSISGSEPESLG